MTAKDLRDEILSILNDVVFTYHGKTACINPFHEHKFEVGFGNEAIRTYEDIDDLMSDPIYDGKCLNEIADQIHL